MYRCWIITVTKKIATYLFYQINEKILKNPNV